MVFILPSVIVAVGLIDPERRIVVLHARDRHVIHGDKVARDTATGVHARWNWQDA